MLAQETPVRFSRQAPNKVYVLPSEIMAEKEQTIVLLQSTLEAKEMPWSHRVHASSKKRFIHLLRRAETCLDLPRLAYYWILEVSVVSPRT